MISLLVFLFLFPDLEVAKLIADLGSDKFKIRETATKQLKEMGQKALPQVKTATKNSDPEIARRAEQIIDAYYNEFPFTDEEMPYIGKIPEESPYIELGFKELSKLRLFTPRDTRSQIWNNASKWMKAPNQPRRVYLSVTDFYHGLAWKQYGKYHKVYKTDFVYHRIATRLFAQDLIKWGVPKKEIVKLINEIKGNATYKPKLQAEPLIMPRVVEVFFN